MSESVAFVKEFVRLLKKTNWPNGLDTPTVVLHLDVIEYLLTLRAMGKFAGGFGDGGQAESGGPGGGVPHRLALLLEYLNGISPEAVKFAGGTIAKAG
jgi:hypothetical protein